MQRAHPFPSPSAESEVVRNEKTYRLAPGEYCEIPAAGVHVGLGAKTDNSDWASVHVGARIDTKPGDEVRFSPCEVPLLCGVKDGADLWQRIVEERVGRELPIPAAAAERKQIIRRVTLDLCGQPPMPEEIAAFVADKTSAAAANLEKRLADRPGMAPFTGTLPPGDIHFRMPNDPIKTLVEKDGSMFNVDALKLIPVSAADAEWMGQELAGPRVPIVRTHRRAGDLEIVEEAFVSPIAADAARVKFPFVERIGGRMTVRDWASPTMPCEPAFRHAARQEKMIVHYRFHAEKDQTYTVVFGFCEGADNKPGDRLLDIEIEAKNRRRLDLAKEYGKNVPVLIPFEAKDEDGDGLIDLAVAPG